MKTIDKPGEGVISRQPFPNSTKVKVNGKIHPIRSGDAGNSFESQQTYEGDDIR